MKILRRQFTIILALQIAALAYYLAAPKCAEALGRDIHASMASYAKMLANNNLDPDATAVVPEWMEEINFHVPEEYCPVDPNLCDLDEYYNITIGAANEDELDHVWNREGFCVTITHFWDPDLGHDATMNSAVCHYSDPNAYQKASVLWGMALGQYYMGNKAVAYEYLGHIVHLLGDMTVPTHAHFDMHIYPDTYDDQYIYDHQYLSDDEMKLIQGLGMIEIPNPPVLPDGTGLLPLYWLFYTTAQIGGYYPSDGTEGNTTNPYNEGNANDPYNLVNFSLLEALPTDANESGELDGCDYSDPESACGKAMATIRRNTYFYGIRAVPALYKLFAETVKKQAELTVVLDSLTNVDQTGSTSEPGAPEFFTRVYIGGYDAEGTPYGLWLRNQGDMILDLDVGETSPLGVHDGARGNGWAFAYNVGSDGPARVEIELLDDDGSPGYDDFQLWDICSGPQEAEDAEQRRVWLDINLELCREGGNAISLDVIGPCRDQLTTQGDDDPHAAVSFRVLPPNTAPTADAGEDKTANEGGWVLLEGSFTDPDTEDTHDYLWHLVSSTNGQGVPDSTATVLSFMPCDNGIYTFRFTVTDNHGAWDSDEVVVTVMNVAPVVSAPYISHQPNAEFILPVVHKVDFEGTFTDAGSCDTHTAVWDCSDGSPSEGLVSETSGSGSVTGSHVFSVPGDFTVTLTVTDDDGGSGSNTMSIHIADIGEALDIFNAYIQSLPSDVFKNSADQRKKSYNNMFNALDDMLANQEYLGMIKFLNSNIRTTFDGLLGGSSKDDWIEQNQAIQAELCQKVDDITAYLQYLLSNTP